MEAKQVPLYEQLEDVPIDARLVIEDSDGMGATILAIGRMCHGAAAALRAAIEQAKKPRQWQGLTDEEKHQLNDSLNLQGRFPIIDAIEAKLKERNK